MSACGSNSSCRRVVTMNSFVTALRRWCGMPSRNRAAIEAGRYEWHTGIVCAPASGDSGHAASRCAPQSAGHRLQIDVRVLYGLPAVYDSQQMKTARPDRTVVATAPIRPFIMQIASGQMIAAASAEKRHHPCHLTASSVTEGFSDCSPGISTGAPKQRLSRDSSSRAGH